MSPSCQSTMHNAARRCITYQNGYLSIAIRPSCNPHPALTRSPQPSWTRCEEFLAWGGQARGMNDLHCATLGRPGSPPPVFNYSGGRGTQIRWAMWQADASLSKQWQRSHANPPALHYRIIQVIRHSLKGAWRRLQWEISGERMCLVYPRFLEVKIEPRDFIRATLIIDSTRLGRPVLGLDLN